MLSIGLLLALSPNGTPAISSSGFKVAFHGTTYRTAVWTSKDDISPIIGYVSTLEGIAPKGQYVRVGGTADTPYPLDTITEPNHKSSDEDVISSAVRRVRNKNAPKTVKRKVQLALLKGSRYKVTIPKFKFETKPAYQWVIPSTALSFKAGDLTFTSRRPLSSVDKRWIIEFKITGDNPKAFSDVQIKGAFFGISPGGSSDRYIAVLVPQKSVESGNISGTLDILIGKPLDSKTVTESLTPHLFDESPQNPKLLDFEFDAFFPASALEKKILPK